MNAHIAALAAAHHNAPAHDIAVVQVGRLWVATLIPDWDDPRTHEAETLVVDPAAPDLLWEYPPVPAAMAAAMHTARMSGDPNWRDAVPVPDGDWDGD